MSAPQPLAVVAWRSPNGAAGHGCPLAPDLAAVWVKVSNGRGDGLVHWAAPVEDAERAEACSRRGGGCDCGALAGEAMAKETGR